MRARWLPGLRSTVSASSRGGTDTHLFLVDMHSRGITGRDAELALERAGMTVNKNAIPFDPLPPLKAGGIRVGSPAVTTRGMREPEMEKIAAWIADVLTHLGDTATEQRVRGEVAALAAKFPLYARRLEAADAPRRFKVTAQTPEFVEMILLNGTTWPVNPLLRCDRALFSSKLFNFLAAPLWDVARISRTGLGMLSKGSRYDRGNFRHRPTLGN